MQPFLLSPCRLGRFASRNVCTSAETEIPCSNDVNQCLYHKSGSHGVPDINLFDFMFLFFYSERASAKLRCFFFVVLFCLFFFNEEYIPGILTGLK